MKTIAPISKPIVRPRAIDHGTAALEHAFGMMIYGPPKVGKTSFVAEFQNYGQGVGFIHDPTETGILSLREFNRCPKPKFVWKSNGFEHCIELIQRACHEKISTLAIDAATGLQAQCFSFHCHKYFNDNWTDEGFFAYQRGPKNAAARDWPRLIEALTDLRNAGKNVILIAHSQVKPFKNPDGADYEEYTPYLEKDIWAATHRWTSCILFYNFHTDVEKQGLRLKAKAGTQKRIIYTDGSSPFTAGNVYGLEPVIMAGDSSQEAYQAFMKAYMKAQGQ